jgi:hypothetical protein
MPRAHSHSHARSLSHLWERLGAVLLEEADERLVLQQHALLQNLDVGLGLAQQVELLFSVPNPPYPANKPRLSATCISFVLSMNSPNEDPLLFPRPARLKLDGKMNHTVRVEETAGVALPTHSTPRNAQASCTSTSTREAFRVEKAFAAQASGFRRRRALCLDALHTPAMQKHFTSIRCGYIQPLSPEA